MADAPVEGREPEPETEEQRPAPENAAEAAAEETVEEPAAEQPAARAEAEADGDDSEQDEQPAAPAAGFDPFAPKVKPAPIPVSEAPEVEPEDEDDEPEAERPAAAAADPEPEESDDDADEDARLTQVVRPLTDASAPDEDTDAEADETEGDGDGDDEDGPIPPAPPATEVEETTLIPKVTEPRAESTTVLPPVSAPTPGMAHRPYTSAPSGYGGGRAARMSWGAPLPPNPPGQPDAQPTQVQPAVPETDVESTRVQPSVLGAAPQTGTARGYRPPEFHKVDPERDELPLPQNFKLDRRELDGEPEGSKKLGRRALLAGGGVAVAAAAGLGLAGVIKLPGTTQKIPTVGFAPATNSGASAATQTGTAFLTAWQNGELETAANLTDSPSEALAALTWYKKNLGVVGLVLNPNAANSVGWMTFAITTQAGSPMGQWQYQSGFAAYSKQVDGYTRWFVQWSPQILYTSLKSGYQLKIHKTPASVKGVVDRNGTLIDTTKHPSLASLVNVLVSKATVTGATDGQQIIMVDAKGNQVATVATLTNPINNGTVESTLDMNVQTAAEAAVTFKANSALVAIQPSTGHILAIANNTTSQYYDNALLARVAPGSTFKIITSTALLSKGIVTLNSDAPCPTTLTITNNVLHNSEGEGGDYTYSEDFARSCNNAFSNFYNHSGMTANLLSDTAKNYFGLNQQWDIGVGETAQYMTVQENLSGAGLAESLVGQDQIVACPLAMCSVAATVATGTFKQPIVTPKQTQITATALPSSVQSSLKTMMSEVIDSSIGTAAGVGFPNNGHFFGKTGTAEVDNGANNNSWFVVFHDQKDIALCALAIDGGYGASTAAPECLTVFKKLGYA
jgi:Penicillin binding protein transpeptidase domain